MSHSPPLDGEQGADAGVIGAGNRILSRGMPNLAAVEGSSGAPHRSLEVSSEPAYPDEDGIVYTQTTTVSYSTAPITVERSTVDELPEPLRSYPTRTEATWIKRSADTIEVETVFRGDGNQAIQRNEYDAGRLTGDKATLLEENEAVRNNEVNKGREEVQVGERLVGDTSGDGSFLGELVPAPPLAGGNKASSLTQVEGENWHSTKLSNLVDEMHLDSPTPTTTAA